MKEAAQLRPAASQINLTNDDDVANGGPIHNDGLDHRDGPSRVLG
jgi:hypothetical protein